MTTDNECCGWPELGGPCPDCPDPEVVAWGHERRVLEFCKSKGDQTIYPSDVSQALDISWDDANSAMEKLRANGELRDDD